MKLSKFPRKVNGKYLMLLRPSDNGHTPFGDMFLSQSPDMEHWGYHRFVMQAQAFFISPKYPSWNISFVRIKYIRIVKEGIF